MSLGNERAVELRARYFWAEAQLESLRNQRRELEEKLSAAKNSIGQLEAIKASCSEAICSYCGGRGNIREAISEDQSDYRKCSRCKGSGLDPNFK